MSSSKAHDLKNLLKQAIDEYIECLDGTEPTNLYHFFMEEMQASLIEHIYQRTKYNKSIAARWSGLSRLTFRRMLNRFKIEDSMKTETSTEYA